MENLDLTIGDVLRLDDDIGEISAGLYVAISLDLMVTLSRLGEDEDGNLCTTCRTHKVTWHEAAQFVPMQLTIDPPLEELSR